MQTTSGLAAARFLVLLVILPLSACHGRGGDGGGEGSAYGMFSGGDVQQDTTLRFGPLDTSLLTNGSGWVRTQPGVMPPNMQPQQLQAPVPQPVDSSVPDTVPTPVPDSLRRNRVRPTDSLRRPSRDTVRPDTSHPIPDTTDHDDLR